MARPVPVLALVLLLSAAAFMTVGARGDWSFVLTHRGTRLAALLVVAVSVATATMIFQTVSGNRILTPSVMGFDSLFLLLQTALVAAIGGVGLVALGQQARFGIEFLLLMVAALLLFGTLLGRGRPDVQRMILVGLVMGVLFRSLSGFVQRLIDPNEFAVVQSSAFARFSAVELDLLGFTAVLTGLACAGAWAMRHRLDVLALGREAAIGLGLNHRRAVIAALVLTAALVSASTALVGPVTFFGLLVAALAHRIAGTHRHAVLLPVAALVAAIALVAGQVVVERVMGLTATLSIVIEVLGGLAFLVLVLKGPVR